MISSKTYLSAIFAIALLLSGLLLFLNGKQEIQNVNQVNKRERNAAVQDRYCIDYKATASEEEKQVQDVSLIQLISNPREYHCKKVRVIGFVRIEFEGTAIYLHYEDYKYRITENAIWLTITDEIVQNHSKYNMKYVLVEGVFNAYDQGHMGLFGGSIKDINRFDIWADPKVTQ